MAEMPQNGTVTIFFLKYRNQKFRWTIFMYLLQTLIKNIIWFLVILLIEEILFDCELA